MNYLLPDVEPRKPPPLIEKDDARVRHESLLSGTVATMIFVIFQISDLSDSLSALMAGVLILFPMHYRGAVMRLYLARGWRGAGLSLYSGGAAYPLRSQQPHTTDDAAYRPRAGVWCASACDGRRWGDGVGFASITTIGIMFGQNMHPNSDTVFSDLYRITSVTFSLVATLTMVFLVRRSSIALRRRATSLHHKTE